ncbi:hypothetical protein SAMN02745166_01521 [Prosthecobacter debontii]|uniref:Uncharacterized protein n=1 Tax=Prosthecobacter debontii TaxID=48467 RepID=A0A1T4XHI2_9BACT|nr:hypothetical protein [Prosthecobacter debontii]SKA88999.1 hypothetical protein SAMN02745166_01521 [Prosthecobacter debontii]
MPDKNLGTAPDYDQALLPGENHWMMVAGLSSTSPSYYPVVLENSAQASWPPTWTDSTWWGNLLGTKRERGMAWKDQTVIIAYNDASVGTVKLEQKGEYLHLPADILAPEGKEPLPPMKILDIEVERNKAPHAQ